MLLYTTAGLLVLIALLTHFLRKSNRNKNLPPFVRTTLPILGNVYEMASSMIYNTNFLTNALQSWAATYGPLFRINLQGQDIIVVSDVDFGYEVFVANGGKLNQRQLTVFSMDEATDDRVDILTANGEIWKQNRKLLVQGVIRNLKRSEDIINSTLDRTMAHIAAENQSERGIELGKLLKRHSSNIILDIAFGGVAIPQARREQFLEAMDTIIDYSQITHPRNLFPILKYFPSYEDKFRKLLKVRDEIMEEIFVAHEKDFKEGEPRDFVDVVLELSLDGSITKFQRRQILFDTFVGGTDTTATIAEWLIAYLVNNPDIQKQVQQELDEVLHGKVASYEEASKLPLLQAAILETFRLRPVFSLVDRVTDKEYKLGEYVVPANHQIWLNLQHLSMSPTLWNQPEQFRPQRFLEEEKGFAFRGAEPPRTKGDIRICPFGIGPRACPGFQLGKMGLVLLTARMLQTYNWTSTNGEIINLDATTALITKPKSVLRFKAQSRKEN